MDLIADALLIAGALGAAIYCRILARRLGALRDLDSGLGAAIAALSRQVDELRASLEAAKTVSGDEGRRLTQLTARAEMAAGRLELLLASLHENGQRRPIAPRGGRATEADGRDGAETGPAPEEAPRVWRPRPDASEEEPPSRGRERDDEADDARADAALAAARARRPARREPDDEARLRADARAEAEAFALAAGRARREPSLWREP